MSRDDDIHPLPKLTPGGKGEYPRKYEDMQGFKRMNTAPVAPEEFFATRSDFGQSSFAVAPKSKRRSKTNNDGEESRRKSQGQRRAPQTAEMAQSQMQSSFAASDDKKTSKGKQRERALLPKEDPTDFIGLYQPPIYHPPPLGMPQTHSTPNAPNFPLITSNAPSYPPRRSSSGLQLGFPNYPAQPRQMGIVPAVQQPFSIYQTTPPVYSSTPEPNPTAYGYQKMHIPPNFEAGPPPRHPRDLKSPKSRTRRRPPPGKRIKSILLHESVPRAKKPGYGNREQDGDYDVITTQVMGGSQKRTALNEKMDPYQAKYSQAPYETIYGMTALYVVILEICD